MRSLGHNVSENELSAIMAEIDTDGNGFINFAEFVRLMISKARSQDSEEELLKAFAVFDEKPNNHNTGLISAKKLRHVLTHVGEKWDEDEVEELLKLVKVDAEGKFRYADVVKILCKK